MKKWIAAAAVLLCLTGCSSQSQPDGASEAIKEQPQPEIVEAAPVEEVPVEEVPVEEVPMEEAPSAELTEEAPEQAIDTFAMSEEVSEGLVNDTIGYSFAVPAFAGFAAADHVTAFYAALTDNLIAYTEETVNEWCVDQGLMASVFGELTDAKLVNSGLGLQVTYTFRVEYSNGESSSNVRTDTFHVVTGDVESVTD